MTRGVFVNPALQEPFGLTVIEAAAHGVPTVATKNGGPVDIMATLHHGVVVDPTDSDAIAVALLKILTNPQVWDTMSVNGTKNIMVRGRGGALHPLCAPLARCSSVWRLPTRRRTRGPHTASVTWRAWSRRSASSRAIGCVCAAPACRRGPVPQAPAPALRPVQKHDRTMSGLLHKRVVAEEEHDAALPSPGADPMLTRFFSTPHPYVQASGSFAHGPTS